MVWFRRAPIVIVLAAIAVSATSAAVMAAGNPGPTPVPPPPTVQGNFCGDLGLITISADVDSWNATM